MNYSDFSKNVLNWYSVNKRDLPWRYKNNSQKDPYKIWVSEIMLQQTTVATVIPYYKKFLKKWPNIKKLSKSSINEVLDFWSGLGYYRRAHNLKNCAKTICEKYDGKFPNCAEELLKLPGIGNYTAAAITSIAYNKLAFPIDGNIQRIVSRLFEIRDEIKSDKSNLLENLKEIFSQKRPGDFAQAMMDLGYIICKPANPTCDSCT